jgi:hypothetical protein
MNKNYNTCGNTSMTSESGKFSIMGVHKPHYGNYETHNGNKKNIKKISVRKM